MQTLLAWTLAAIPAPASQGAHPARDETREARAIVEVDAPSSELFVGQRVPLRLRFALEGSFLDREMVQPFGVRLDVPVQVAWKGVELPEEHGVGVATFAWNEAVRSVRRIEDRVVADRTYRVYAAEAEILAAGPGTLAVTAPILSYAYATRFEETLLSGRVAADRVDAFVTGPALELRVSPLPEAGRPTEFTGAVGAFTVEAEAEPRALDLDGSLRLRLSIRGRGNLESFEAPRWKEVGGFRVLGIVDEATPGQRVFTLDLAPYSDAVWQIPAIPFAYFDPGDPPGYRTVRTDPIEVEVRKVAPPIAGPSPPAADERKPAAIGWWLAGAAALLGVLAAWLRRRRT